MERFGIKKRKIRTHPSRGRYTRSYIYLEHYRKAYDHMIIWEISVRSFQG